MFRYTTFPWQQNVHINAIMWLSEKLYYLKALSDNFKIFLLTQSVADKTIINKIKNDKVQPAMTYSRFILLILAFHAEFLNHIVCRSLNFSARHSYFPVRSRKKLWKLNQSRPVLYWSTFCRRMVALVGFTNCNVHFRVMSKAVLFYLCSETWTRKRKATLYQYLVKTNLCGKYLQWHDTECSLSPTFPPFKKLFILQKQINIFKKCHEPIESTLICNNCPRSN